jgi:hypothetical protein
MLTNIPEIIFLFVALIIPPEAGRLPFTELYRTTDQRACESQAAEWTAKVAATPLKSVFICLPHNQKKLKEPGASEE